MKWFRGGLVFKAHRLCVSLNFRLESNKEEEGVEDASFRALHATSAGWLGLRVEVAGCRVQGAGFRVCGVRFSTQSLGCRVQGLGFRVQGSGFRVQGSGFRVQGSGFRVQGSGLGSRHLRAWRP